MTQKSNLGGTRRKPGVQKSHTITIAVTPKEMEWIRHSANKYAMTPGEFVKILYLQEGQNWKPFKGDRVKGDASERVAFRLSGQQYSALKYYMTAFPEYTISGFFRYSMFPGRKVRGKARDGRNRSHSDRIRLKAERVASFTGIRQSGRG